VPALANGRAWGRRAGFADVFTGKSTAGVGDAKAGAVSKGFVAKDVERKYRRSGAGAGLTVDALAAAVLTGAAFIERRGAASSMRMGVVSRLRGPASGVRKSELPDGLEARESNDTVSVTESSGKRDVEDAALKNGVPEVGETGGGTMNEESGDEEPRGPPSWLIESSA
jgi:hypothetical protein